MGSPNSALFTNLLPYDGVADYYAGVFSRPKANEYFTQLMRTTAWQHDEAVMFGKRIITKRKVAWYGDEDYTYTYSKIARRALPWTDTLQQIKAEIEAVSGHTFNSCLLNLYHNGEEGMGWHSDDERTLGDDIVIASLSLGAERKFSFKHKRNQQTVSVALEHGSLLVMKGATQTHWLHMLPKTKKVHQPRINLTFRTIFP